MSIPNIGFRTLQSRFRASACLKCACPLLLSAILLLCPATDSYGQDRSVHAQSRSQPHTRQHHPLDPVPKLKQLQHKIARSLFGTPARTPAYRPPARPQSYQQPRHSGGYGQSHHTNGYGQHPQSYGQRPPVIDPNAAQRMQHHGRFQSTHHAERIGVTSDQRMPDGFEQQYRNVNYQQEQLFNELDRREDRIRAEQRWQENNDFAPRQPILPARNPQYANPADAQFSPLHSSGTYHSQNSGPPVIIPNHADVLPPNAADRNSGFPINSLRSSGQNPNFNSGNSQYASPAVGRPTTRQQQPRSGGHMGAGTNFHGEHFAVPPPTATERALELESEVAELKKRVAFLEKVNEQLRQRVNQYDNVTSQTTTKMNQVAQQLIQADESNQKLLQKIAFLESENQKIRMEAARVLDSIKHNLDDLLIRELKDSNSTGQLRINQ